MNSTIPFVELDNRVISATCRNLMIGAKVELFDNANGRPLAEPLAKIISAVPSGSLRMSLPDSVGAGTYFLRALNGHGQFAARSIVFHVV